MAGDEGPVQVEGSVQVITDGCVETELRAVRAALMELNQTLTYVGNTLAQAVDGIAAASRRPLGMSQE
jgi:hypothetical protein